MTFLETKKYINSCVKIKLLRNQLTVNVIIKDIRYSYGRTEALVSPEYGLGEAWVDTRNLEFFNTPHIEDDYEGATKVETIKT